MISIETLFNDHQLYHSDFQMDCLITVRAGGTTFGCYRQALRELWKRYRGLRELYSQSELLAIDIDEIRHATATDQFQQRRARVQLASKRLAQIEMKKSIADTEREFIRFYSQASDLKQSIGEIDAERRRELDREMWEHRIRCSAAIDFMATGRLSVNTIEMLQAAPMAMRRLLATEVLDPNQHRALVDWYLGYSPNIPTASPIAAINVRKLLEC